MNSSVFIMSMMPRTVLCTLSMVKSSPMTPRQPEVPKTTVVVAVDLRALAPWCSRILVIASTHACLTYCGSRRESGAQGRVHSIEYVDQVFTIYAGDQRYVPHHHPSCRLGRIVEKGMSTAKAGFA